MSGIESAGGPKPPIQQIDANTDGGLEKHTRGDIKPEKLNEMEDKFSSLLAGKSQGVAHASEQGLAHGVGLDPANKKQGFDPASAAGMVGGLPSPNMVDQDETAKVLAASTTIASNKTDDKD